MLMIDQENIRNKYIRPVSGQMEEHFDMDGSGEFRL